MQRILICSGVLGGGTAIVFMLAALTASLFPNGTVLSTGWSGPWLDQRAGWGGMPAPVMLDVPAMEPEFRVTEEFDPLPGDQTLEWPADDQGVVPAP